MINKALDEKVLELNKEYKNLNSELNNIEEQIENLEYDKDRVSTRMDEIEDEIRCIKKEMLNKKIQEIDIETEDTFIKDFIIASYFCNKDFNTNHNLQYVNITDDEIQACDGMKAIIIKNLNIPDVLKNNLIKWDIRSEFEANIDKDINGYADIHGSYPNINNYKFKLENLTVEEFYSKVNMKHHSDNWHGETITLTTDTTIGVNKEYMDTALLAFKGESFTLYTDTPVSAILLSSLNKSVIVMPMRI